MILQSSLGSEPGVKTGTPNGFDAVARTVSWGATGSRVGGDLAYQDAQVECRQHASQGDDDVFQDRL